jgi:hypothetical protein
MEPPLPSNSSSATPPLAPPQPPGPAPAASTTASPPGAPTSTFRARRWLPLAGAAIVGALVATLLIAVFRDDDDGANTDPIELPDTIDDLRLRAQAAERLGNDDVAEQFRSRDFTATQRGIELVQRAFGGAAADVRIYTDDELQTSATVVAVRASNGGLFSLEEFVDPEDLGSVVARQVVVIEAEVECLAIYERTLRPDDVADGEVPPPDQYVYCQRSDEDLTVVVQMFNIDSMTRASEIVDSAWAGVGGE